MGGGYPTDVDLFVFRTHPRFVVSYGSDKDGSDQLEEIRAQLTPQAEAIHHFEVLFSSPWDDALESLCGFINGRACQQRTSNRSENSSQKHEDLFLQVSQKVYSNTPYRLINSDDASCSATLYTPPDLQCYHPILRQSISPHGSNPLFQDTIESITEWVRVCSLTQRYLAVLARNQ